MRVWNVQTGECMSTLKGHKNLVRCVAFDGTTIVSGSYDKTVRIWRAPYSTAEFERVIEGYKDYVNRVWLCTAPNEHIAVSVDGDNRNNVHLHDIRTGDRVCPPIACVDGKLS